GAGDGAALTRAWKFDHNWREGKPQERWQSFWVKPSAADTHQEKIDGVERDPKSADFLRPAKGSELATKGAGGDDPALPVYVGAVQPEGTQAWDWGKTWKALTEKAERK